MWGTHAYEDWKPRDGLFLSFLAQSRNSAAVCFLGGLNAFGLQKQSLVFVLTKKVKRTICIRVLGLIQFQTCTSGLLNVYLDSLYCAGNQCDLITSLNETTGQ